MKRGMGVHLVRAEVRCTVLVFRDHKHAIEGRSSAHALERSFDKRNALDALLGAAELEAALADAHEPTSAALESWTNAAAFALVHGGEIRPPSADFPRVPPIPLSISRPEGFAYYGVHPLDYARRAAHVLPQGAPALVIGIRTIGVALSATVLAALSHQDREIHRITVRPNGHPFDRKLVLNRKEEATVQRIASIPGGWILIVDEGPGLSGSSFLAVADAVIVAGMPRDRIVLITSHAPDITKLRAPSAMKRWSALRSVVAGPCHVPNAEYTDISAGAWRQLAYLDENAWPAVWSQMERRKFVRRGHDVFLKFEGLGMYGHAARLRGEALFESGIGAKCSPHEHGFLSWEWVRGRPFFPGQDRMPIDFIARSIAARLTLPVARSFDHDALESMVRINVHELLGRDIELQLPTNHVVIVDGRMQPHEWIQLGDRIVKVDGVAHGDDHFFPGPCDIAWDLAGAIIEWHMNADQTRALLERYVQFTGDSDVFRRISPWKTAYLAFRAGWLSMAQDACAGDNREQRRNARALVKVKDELDLSTHT